MSARIATTESSAKRRFVVRSQPTPRDRQTLATISIDPAAQQDDHFDYSKVVVRKPWGYEYLIYQNADLAIWVLHLKHGFQTSLHCHPRKETSITVLSGIVVCSTLEESFERHPGDMVVLGKGVFHRSAAASAGGAILMEVETPVNKRDLVRYQDDHGREGLGYETVDQMTLNVQNYNYTTLIDPGVYYNVERRLGMRSIQLARFEGLEELLAVLETPHWETATILKGALVAADGSLLTAGALITLETLAVLASVKNGPLETILVGDGDAGLRVSDLAVAHLKGHGLGTYFYVPGSSNMHLVDSIGRDADALSICFQTENAATLAAEGFAKLTGTPAVVVVASGSAAAGGIIGVADAFVDSAPMLVLSGQSRTSEQGAPGDSGLRQLANLELNVAEIVRPITKHASVVREAAALTSAIDLALDISLVPRKGPVWLDIPLNVLGMRVTEKSRVHGSPPARPVATAVDAGSLRALEALIAKSRRPVILAGHGIRASNAQEAFVALVDKLQVPVLLSRRGADLLTDDFRWYFGRPGTYGQRAANFVIQNSDLLIAIGCRLSPPLTGRNHAAFARHATKVVVDVDPLELRKPTVAVDLAIKADAGDFIHAMLALDGTALRPEWVQRCAAWRERYAPSREVRSPAESGVDPYQFLHALSDALEEDDILVVDGGHSLDFVMQSLKLKRGQRIISSPGLEHQGFALPAAIGICAGAPSGRRIVCLCEKKGLQRHLPELETIANLQLPIKVFVLNAKGNPGVERIQAAYFGGRYVGPPPDGIVGALDVARISQAYRLASSRIDDASELEAVLAEALRPGGAMLCEVRLPDHYEITPRVALTVTQDGKWDATPIEDMYPFLDRDEFKAAMVIAPLDKGGA